MGRRCLPVKTAKTLFNLWLNRKQQIAGKRHSLGTCLVPPCRCRTCGPSDHHNVCYILLSKWRWTKRFEGSRIRCHFPWWDPIPLPSHSCRWTWRPCTFVASKSARCSRWIPRVNPASGWPRRSSAVINKEQKLIRPKLKYGNGQKSMRSPSTEVRRPREWHKQRRLLSSGHRLSWRCGIAAQNWPGNYGRQTYTQKERNDIY